MWPNWRNQISLFKIIDLSYTLEAKHKFYPQLLVNSGLINVNYYYVIIRDLIPKISTLKRLKTTMFKPEKF